MVGGKYRILKLIARGGMGRIYLAEQIPLRRTVAFKLLSPRPHQDSEGEFRARFFLEAATLGRLKHPNTVTVFDYGEVQGSDTFYMAMEYVEGRTLSQLLREEGALHPVRAMRIAYEITRSLSEAHELNIVHRDLKPGNVMIGESAEGSIIKVLDFGIAKVLEDNADHVTRADQLIGSPRYMAPEQIRSDNVDTRADQYALGVMLYEMVTGTAPFRGASSVDVLLAHLQQPVPPMSELTRREVPRSVEALVQRMLRKAPDERFANIKEVREALLAVISELDDPLPAAMLPRDSGSQSRVTGTRPAVRPVETDPSQATIVQARPPGLAENRRMLGIAALAGLLLIATLALLWFKPGVHREPVAVAPAVVQLTLVSDPPGATVLENGRALGQTPLTLPHLAQGQERAFELRLEGYAPATLRQGEASADLALSASLTPLPEAAPEAAPPPVPPTPSPPKTQPLKAQPPKTTAPKADPPPGDDMGLRSRR